MMGLDALWDEIDASGGDFAFTPGKMFTDPDRHAMTIVAGEVGFSLDLRSLHSETLEMIEARLPALAAEIGERRRVGFELGAMTKAEPGVMAEELLGRLRDGVSALGLEAMELASGAAHDAAAFAAAGTPTAMIFIRNRNGSHNPDEAMKIDDFMDATLLTAYLVAEVATG
jgi:N-carbamoyl-L-amino-acid hydrolase